MVANDTNAVRGHVRGQPPGCDRGPEPKHPAGEQEDQRRRDEALPPRRYPFCYSEFPSIRADGDTRRLPVVCQDLVARDDERGMVDACVKDLNSGGRGTDDGYLRRTVVAARACDRHSGDRETRGLQSKAIGHGRGSATTAGFEVTHKLGYLRFANSGERRKRRQGKPGGWHPREHQPRRIAAWFQGRTIRCSSGPSSTGSHPSVTQVRARRVVGQRPTIGNTQQSSLAPSDYDNPGVVVVLERDHTSTRSTPIPLDWTYSSARSSAACRGFRRLTVMAAPNTRPAHLHQC